MKTQSIARKPGRPVDPERQSMRRADILRAAAGVFSRRGYERADVADIAALAGLTKASVYHYFASKEQLFFATVDARLGEIAQTMARLADAVHSSMEGIADAVEAYLTFFEQNPDAVELMIEERASFKTREAHTYFLYREATLQTWVAALERLIAAGVLRPVQPATTLRLLSDLLYGRVITNFFVADPRPARAQSEEIVDVLFNGLRADAPQS